MSGPLVNVNTKVESLNLDISRKLNMGPNKILKFLIPDTNQMTNYRTLLVLSKGFDRITPSEETSGSGSDVVIDVADPTGAVGIVIREPDLHVELEDQIYSVDEVPPVSSSEAQVYRLTCKSRTTRVRYFR